jgi:peptidoglycan/LPS O-acetylase OafA/YrhL
MKSESAPANPPAGMPMPFSLYLDLVRFMAALAVFLSHLDSVPFTRDVLWWRIGLYGDTAVTLFFVLSGYVIAFVSANQERTAESYFGSRVSRLYSIVLIALPLTYLFDTVGMASHPGFYNTPEVLGKPESWTAYIAAFFFLNEYQAFGFGGIVPGTNGPYWSLSFEATYYLLGGIVLFSRKMFWIPATIIILLLAGSAITALLPLWVLGFALYRIRLPEFTSTSLLHVVFWMSALLIICSPGFTRHLPTSVDYMSLPWGRGQYNRNIIIDYFIAISFAAHLISARALMAKECKPIVRLRPAIRWLGSLTFPLYVFHYPALCLFSSICPWGDTSIKRAIFVSMMTALLVIMLTPLCDQLKITIRKNFAFGKFIHPRVLQIFARYAGRAPLQR